MSTQADDPLSDLVQRQATRHRAGDRLKAQIHTSILMADASRAMPSDQMQPSVRPSKRGWRALLAPSWSPAPAAAGGFVFGVVMTVALLVPIYHDRGPELVPLTGYTGLLVADHVRALAKGPLLEVISTDRHTVKPWFQGKLNYAPPVIDLASKGFALAGARIDKVQAQDVAVLVFRHGGHWISLYVSPSTMTSDVSSKLVNGFRVGQWSNAGMSFWMVTDMDEKEASRFISAWSEAQARN